MSNLTSSRTLHKEQLTTECSITSVAQVNEKIDAIVTIRIETIAKSISEKLTIVFKKEINKLIEQNNVLSRDISQL